MNASIITIGDEILIGQIVDTNSVSIARHLNDAGIVVREKVSIGDDRSAIVETLRRSLAASQAVSAPPRTTSPRRRSPRCSAAGWSTTRSWRPMSSGC